MLMVNSNNPTVSTLSKSFVAAANDRAAPGWEGQVWDQSAQVSAVTLDDLIARHGRPGFVKIDVEGAELDVLRGLSSALDMLSFEFTTLQRHLAYDCVDRCKELGMDRFNVSLRESQTFQMSEWVDAASMKALIERLPPDANSGDVYASPSASRSSAMN